jgi:hypothetical protein
MSKRPNTATKTKTQTQASNTARPSAAAPAAVIPSELPPAADLSFDLGSNLADRSDAPAVTITTPTPNESEMRERFEHVASVEIEASALMPGIACPFTDGCAERGGKVRIMSDVTGPQRLPDGRTAVQRVQQLHCKTCGSIAKGVKPIGGVAVGGPRLFNRLTGKAE